MTIEYIEEVAREKGLRGKEHSEYERMLDHVLDKEKAFVLWNRLFIFSSAVFFWGLLFAAMIFLLGLEYQFEVPSGIGLFLALILIIFFPMFLATMFLSQRHSREMAAHEARILAFLESR